MTRRKTNQMAKKQLNYYKVLLLEKMKEILGDVNQMEENVFQGGGELSSMPVHLADIGTDSYEQEFSLGLMAEERKTLAEIQHALARIQNGTFGMCEGLGIPIEPNRLEAIPWTRYSLEYARMVESGKIPKNDNFRRRPIDIEREQDQIDSEEEETDAIRHSEDEADVIDEDADTEDTDSVDEIQEEEDYDEEDEDVERHRDSA